jgi:hypothetical protein
LSGLLGFARTPRVLVRGPLGFNELLEIRCTRVEREREREEEDAEDEYTVALMAWKDDPIRVRGGIGSSTLDFCSDVCGESSLPLMVMMMHTTHT